MDISLGSELTIGAGTGSSASFAVCLAGALIQLLKLKMSSGYDAFYEQSSEQFNPTEREIISEWAYNCERIMHGSPSGELFFFFIDIYLLFFICSLDVESRRIFVMFLIIIYEYLVH